MKVLEIATQIAIALLVPPLLLGVIVKVKALFAGRVGACAGVRVETPESNIVMIDLVRDQDDIQAVNSRIEAAGLRIAQYGPRRLRAVMHRDVDRAQVERAAAIVCEVLA